MKASPPSFSSSFSSSSSSFGSSSSIIQKCPTQGCSLSLSLCVCAAARAMLQKTNFTLMEKVFNILHRWMLVPPCLAQAAAFCLLFLGLRVGRKMGAGLAAATEGGGMLLQLLLWLLLLLLLLWLLPLLLLWFAAKQCMSSMCYSGATTLACV